MKKIMFTLLFTLFANQLMAATDYRQCKGNVYQTYKGYGGKVTMSAYYFDNLSSFVSACRGKGRIKMMNLETRMRTGFMQELIMQQEYQELEQEKEQKLSVLQ